MNLLNKAIVTTLPAVPKPVVRYFANRYIAGEHLADAVNVVKNMNSQGMLATMDVLGEHISRREEAISARDAILQVLGAIERQRLDSNVSIKLTQLGLALDRSFCLENVQTVVQRAKEISNFIRIDMEDSSTTDDTLWVYRELRKNYTNVGIVLQAYLRRTEHDAVSLIDEGWGHFRLCKGIYVEPEAIAYKSKSDINENFVRVMNLMLQRKAYLGIATHDDALVDAAYDLIRTMNLSRDTYEFQMLLGVRSDLRSKILKDGHRLRVYVPFGRHWYKYSIRRFKENPQIAGYVMKALFSRSVNS